MKKVVVLDYDKQLLPTIGDSMCFDSGFTALSAEVFDGSDKYEVVIKAQGHVKLWWRDMCFKHASSFPDELLEKFRNGTAYKEVEIDENNWWETLIYKDGDYIGGDIFEGEPRDFKNEHEIEDYVLDMLEPCFE